MDLHKHIDIYCERVDPSFWAEPINASTNAAFILSSILLFILARKQGSLKPSIVWLISLIAIIGLGSFLFHTFANTWSKFADVLPIMVFKISFIVIYARAVMDFGAKGIAALLSLFVSLCVIAGSMPYEWLNGSLGYSPALIFILGLGIYHFKMQKREPWVLLISAAVFVVSITLRSIDMLVCDDLPIGIHYMWHILNAVVLYLAVRAVIVNDKRRLTL